MPTVVVDTNVVSYIVKSDTRAALYIPHMAEKELVISFMTLMELQTWALNRRWSDRRRFRLHETLEKRFTIYHSDEVLCRVCSEVVHHSERIGRRMEDADAWIAATALVLELPLLTHNRKDFEHLKNLALISEA